MVTMGEADMLRGFVITTLNKLRYVKSELIRTDDNWKNWRMEDLMKHLQGWLKRNKMEKQSETIQENQMKKGYGTLQREMTSDQSKQGLLGHHCEMYKTLKRTSKFLADNQLCYNSGRAGHIDDYCRSSKFGMV